MNLESGVLQVHIEDIIPNRFQPRLTFDEQGLKELSDSIKEHGIIQPLVLRKLGNKYEIIAGERRYKAAQLAGLTTVPAVISNIDDNKSAEVALVENVQRRDLTAIEEARSYKQLLDKGYLTQEQLAKRMGLSQPSIANKLRLLNLDEEVQQALLEEKISERHARTLLTLSDPNAQKEWLHRIINERLTVRQLDIELKKMKNATSDDETGGIPLIDVAPTVEEIRAKATDLNEKNERMSSEDIMKPQEIVENVEELELDEPEQLTEEVETLSDQIIDTPVEEEPIIEPVVESFTPATTVPEFNIATPNSASTIINEQPVVQNGIDNKFFNFSLDEPEESNNELIDPDVKEEQGLEIIDDNKEFEEINSEPVLEQPMQQEENKKEVVAPKFNNEYQDDFELSSNNKFFTPVKEQQHEEIINEVKEFNPMDAVEKIDTEAAARQEDYDLKYAITSIRNSIKELGNKGFYINVEEIDFDTNYQITININKE